MESVGINIERQHHEVATAGQAEIDMRFDSLVKMADKLQWFKYIVKNVARRHGKTVTFMPKPLFGDNGSGMHVPPVASGRAGKPLFAGEGYAASPRWPCTTSAASSSTARRWPPSATPPPTATSASSRASRPRSTWPTRPATARRLDPHPHVLAQPQGQAPRVPLPRPVLQRLPRLRRLLMAGLDGIENKIEPGPAARQGHLRPVPGGAEGHPEDAGLARRRPRARCETTTNSCSRATSSPRTSSRPGSSTSTTRK